MTLSPLPTLMIEGPVRAALLEDLGRAGDLTTDAIVPATLRDADGIRVKRRGDQQWGPDRAGSGPTTPVKARDD